MSIQRVTTLLIALAMVICLTTAFAATPHQFIRPDDLVDQSSLVQNAVHKITSDEPMDLSAEQVDVSPFTMNSTYFEVLVTNIPYLPGRNDTEYEYTVDTTGFESEKSVSIRSLEFNSTLTDPIGSEYLIKYENNASKHFVFKAKFAKVDEKNDKYQRGLLFRFDVKKWSEAPKINISSRSISTSGTSTHFAPITVQPFVQFGTLKVDLTGKFNKTNQNSNFTFTIENLTRPLGAADNAILLYSYYKAFKIAPTPPKNETFITCTVNNQSAPAWIVPEQGGVEAYLKVDLRAVQTIDTGAKVIFNCPAQIHSEHEHYSEFWIAYTVNDHAHAIEYKAGTDREDVKRAIATILIIVGAVIVALIAIGIFIAVKKSGKKNDTMSINNDNNYHRL